MAEKPELGWKSPNLAGSFESKILHLGGEAPVSSPFPNFLAGQISAKGKLFRK
jgi:hypothetical protein